MELSNQEKRKKTNRKIVISAVIVVIIIAIMIVISSSGSQQTSTNKTNSVSPSDKKTTYQATLLNNANTDSTSLTLPAAGWDANDGWDTEAGYTAQLAQAQNGNNNTIIMPAVIAKNAKTLELEINVKNIGNAAGIPSCTIKASNNSKNFEAGNYFGTTIHDITALNGGSIQPGNYGNGVVDVTISNNGAQYIQAISINCE